MSYPHTQKHFCRQNLSKQAGTWPEIVDLIFDVVAHRDRMVLKRKALGRRKRRLGRKQKRSPGR